MSQIMTKAKLMYHHVPTIIGVPSNPASPKGYPEGTEEFAAQLDQIHQKTGTGFDQGDAIRWNFGKFLVSKDGKTILRFEPMVTPDMMEEVIQEFLKVNE